ncbi:MAG: S1 family peptidase [Polyangiaceae bacterium]
MKNKSTLLVLASALVMVSCVSRSSHDDGQTDSLQQPIYHGTVDTSPERYPGVVALSVVDNTGSFYSCSGTIVKVSGATAWVLTAAHCLEDGGIPAQVFVGADSYASDVKVFAVDRFASDPNYASDAEGNLTHDFALLRFQGATSTLQVIPPMTPEQDSLVAGSHVTFVGYGATDTDPNNGMRYWVDGTLDSVSTYTVQYTQTPASGGPCYGDSGGPAVALINGSPVVAAVTSYGYATGQSSDDCENGIGISARTSGDYDSFIAPFLADSIGEATGDAACESCASDHGCDAQRDACDANADCAALRACLGLAEYTEDFAACYGDHAAGKTLLNELASCACVANVCDLACGMVCIGASVAGGGTAGASGSAGSAGSSTTGGAAGSNNAGSSGSSATSGNAGAAGSTSAAASSGDDGGCSIGPRESRGSRAASASIWLGLLGLCVLRRASERGNFRQQRKRAQQGRATG